MKYSKIQGFRLFNKLNSRLFFILAILLASSFFVAIVSESVDAEINRGL